MRDLIEKLIEVENLAQDAYLAAARAFSDDVNIVDFLVRQAEEEKHHGIMLQHALSIIVGKTFPTVDSVFVADPETARIASQALREIQSRLHEERLSPAELAILVEEAETSEWNDLFVYVMELLDVLGEEFQVAAVHMDQHRAAVDRFVRMILGPIPGPSRDHLEVSVLAPILLIVEDDSSVAKLLSALFRRECQVVVAANGKEALDVIRARHFDAIISDVDMPEMSGVECFLRAVDLDPSIRDLFIFYTGVGGLDRSLAATGVPVLMKPSSIAEIKRVVHLTIARTIEANRRRMTE